MEVNQGMWNYLCDVVMFFFFGSVAENSETGGCADW